MNTLELIKESFETWYNSKSTEKKSIVINYSDEQTLVHKAYHKATISMVAVGIKNGLYYTVPLLSLSENYNHGVTSEEEAKDNLTKKLLVKMLNCCKKYDTDT